MFDAPEWTRVVTLARETAGHVNGAAESPNPLDAPQFLAAARMALEELLALAEPLARSRAAELDDFSAWLTEREDRRSLAALVKTAG